MWTNIKNIDITHISYQHLTTCPPALLCLHMLVRVLSELRIHLHLGSEFDPSFLTWSGLLVCRCPSDTQEKSRLVLVLPWGPSDLLKVRAEFHGSLINRIQWK